MTKLKQINEAWLGLDVLETDLFNPMSLLHGADDDFHLRLTWLMSRPEYLSFTANHILNTQLLPSQSLIISELWNRKFPLLIASRGFGKALSPETPVLCSSGWKPIESIEVGDQVYGSDGKLTRVIGTTVRQKNLKFYKITLRDNRTIRCCEDHLWKVWDKNQNRNKTTNVYSTLSTKDLVKHYFWNRIGKKSNGTEYRFALPVNSAIENWPTKNFIIHPYIIGILLGDGCLTQRTITFSTKDQEIVDKVNKLLPEGYSAVKHKSSVCDFGIKRTNKSLPPFYKVCEQVGIWQLNSKTKFIPNDYQFCDIEQRLELLRGLMDTDGYSDKTIKEYYTISDALCSDFLNLARSLGLHCKHSIKESWIKDTRYADCHRVIIYTNQPIFSLSRKLDYLNHPVSKQGQSKYEKVFITKIEEDGYSDGYCISVDNEDKTYIIKDYIVTHNSFQLALYSILRAMILPRRKIVVVGAAFRQSKVVFEYMETLWRNSPMLRDICDGNSGPSRDTDRCTMRINESVITCLPLGDGQKIRGQRANDIIADEFASIPRDIFENVVAGFAAVSADPIQNVKRLAAQKKARELGIEILPEETQKDQKDNQIILSGTAYYDFNHFATYWKKWKAIIKSKGNITKLKEIFNGDDPPENFDWTQYSIIRMPYELLPPGFMDADQVARSKATVHAGIYQMEYGACFTRDSQGFFKRTLIESCVISNDNQIKDSKGNIIHFEASLIGDTNKKYIFGVDPASEVDNFSIIVLEVNPDHRRVVYCWTTTRSEHKERVKKGYSNETDFYSYCARKIRDLMILYPCIHIAIDAQGGGVAVMESLHDQDKMKEGELPLWPIINDNKPKDTDGERGLHIIEMCQFANHEWLAEANHGMRKDFEDKVLLFPYFDSISLGLSGAEDNMKNRIYDTLEECVLEIEELKDELSMIQMTQTNSGRDRWDTPELIVGTGRKSKMRKDRYSALLMANMASRVLQRTPTQEAYNFYGGFATGGHSNKNTEERLYSGPSWFTDSMKDVY